jgi:hypothetical protein
MLVDYGKQLDSVADQPWTQVLQAFDNLCLPKNLYSPFSCYVEDLFDVVTVL